MIRVIVDVDRVLIREVCVEGLCAASGDVVGALLAIGELEETDDSIFSHRLGRTFWGVGDGCDCTERK